MTDTEANRKLVQDAFAAWADGDDSHSALMLLAQGGPRAARAVPILSSCSRTRSRTCFEGDERVPDIGMENP